MPDPVLRAVVVDDEPAARDAVIALAASQPALHFVGEASSGEEAVRVILRLRPDLLFLDVQMPDLDGFQVLERLGAYVPRGIIFVTAHDEYAVRAFEVHALDYLLKPFGRPRFDAALLRALERLRALDVLSLRQTLDAMLAARESMQREEARAPALLQQTRLAVRDGSKTTMLPLQDVEWIEACGDYVRIHIGKDAYLSGDSIQSMEAALGPALFLRIHRSIMVNLKHIRELHRESDGGGTVVLDTGVRLRVARTRWETLATALKR